MSPDFGPRPRERAKSRVLHMIGAWYPMHASRALGPPGFLSSSS